MYISSVPVLAKGGFVCSFQSGLFRVATQQSFGPQCQKQLRLNQDAIANPARIIPLSVLSRSL